jgi:hypothetical protein
LTALFAAASPTLARKIDPGKVFDLRVPARGELDGRLSRRG